MPLMLMQDRCANILHQSGMVALDVVIQAEPEDGESLLTWALRGSQKRCVRARSMVHQFSRFIWRERKRD